MNTDLLRDVRDHIATEPEHFDMDSYFHDDMNLAEGQSVRGTRNRLRELGDSAGRRGFHDVLPCWRREPRDHEQAGGTALLPGPVARALPRDGV
jgi:hypothetical protein